MKQRFKKIIGAPGRAIQKRKSDAEPDKTGVPRITNETVAEHREAVLGSARKYIYPLQHSKHRVVLLSSSIFLLAIVIFFSYCLLSLYRFQGSSIFLYRVTQVVPFPIARAGNKFVDYENYLFELRRYKHYYVTQQKVDFSKQENKPQLAEYKKRALEQVINDAYVKQLAAQHNVTVSDKEVEDAITILRMQNRLGGSEEVYENVLKSQWGMSVNDYKRVIKQGLLAQKVVSELDIDTHERAAQALNQLQGGADFVELAKQVTEDPGTKESGGDFGLDITATTPDLPAQLTIELFKLKPGEYSGIINTGYALEIVKNLEQNGEHVRGAHIQFNFKDVNGYINDLKEQRPTRTYIKT